MQDLYEELQVSRNAEPEIIEAAYRRLARKYHPDVSADPTSDARMQRIVHAYEVLRDPKQRAMYDASFATGAPVVMTHRLRAWLGMAVLLSLVLVLTLPALRLLLVRGFVFIVVALVVLVVGWYVWRGFRSG